MNLSYGARLRLQREQNHVALATIADRTKIKLSLLEALERDDVSAWPAGIFRRSYFRAYAQAIGLDPEAAVKEFLERHPDPLEEFVTPEPLRGDGESGARRSVTRLRYLIDSAVGALPALRLPQPRFDPYAAASPLADEEQLDFDLSAVDREPTPADAPRPAERVQADPVAAAPSIASDAVAGPDAAARPPASTLPAARVSERTRDVAIDFGTVAELCSRLARAVDGRDVMPVLAGTATAVGALGLIVWMWDSRAGVLGATLAHGYSDGLLAQLPRVPAASDNAIAASFRAAEPRVVPGTDAETGAIVVPLLTAAGCGGVLALELPSGAEQHYGVRAAATIVAAQLATLIGGQAFTRAATA